MNIEGLAYPIGKEAKHLLTRASFIAGGQLSTIDLMGGLLSYPAEILDLLPNNLNQLRVVYESLTGEYPWFENLNEFPKVSIIYPTDNASLALKIAARRHNGRLKFRHIRDVLITNEEVASSIILRRAGLL